MDPYHLIRILNPANFLKTFTYLWITSGSYPDPANSADPESHDCWADCLFKRPLITLQRVIMRLCLPTPFGRGCIRESWYGGYNWIPSALKYEYSPHQLHPSPHIANTIYNVHSNNNNKNCVLFLICTRNSDYFKLTSIKLTLFPDMVLDVRTLFEQLFLAVSKWSVIYHWHVCDRSQNTLSLI